MAGYVDMEPLRGTGRVEFDDDQEPANQPKEVQPKEVPEAC